MKSHIYSKIILFIISFFSPFRIYPSLGVASPWWCHRAHPEAVGPEVQRRQDDLQEVLRPPPPQGHQLPEEEVRSHLKHQAQKEVEVNDGDFLVWRNIQLFFF